MTSINLCFRNDNHRTNDCFKEQIVYRN